jgi:HAD superfamily hydrolase (TIGR01509 family)
MTTAPDTAPFRLSDMAALLLDFDGPVCRVFAGHPAPLAATELRELAYTHGLATSPDLDATSDPLDVLRRAGQERPDLASLLDQTLTRIEVQAIATATPTPGAHDLIRCAHRHGLRLAVASNNSTAAVHAYLDHHDLTEHVRAVHGRPPGQPWLMKPHPHVVHEAIASVDTTPDRCAFLGDSPSDIHAGHAAHVRTIALITRPAKRDPLLAATPDTTLSDLGPLLADLHC